MTHLLHAVVSHMDDESNWLPDQDFSRSLNATERAELLEIMNEKFWVTGNLETDYGETAILWSLEGFDEKRFRSIKKFYSDQPTSDRIAELGQWVLQLAGIPSLESYVT